MDHESLELNAHLHGTLAGWVDWELVDPDGTVVRRGSQSNLILNRGLDAFGTSGHGSTVTSGSAQYHYFSQWRRVLAVGTGAAEPVATQTALVAEVLRAEASGGFPQTSSFTTDTVAGTLIGTFVLNRVIDFTANYNLSEFGLSDVTTAGGVVNIRELFRDAGGNAITMSVQSGQQLRLTHTLTVTLSPFKQGVAAADFTITGLGVMQGQGTFLRSTDSSGTNVAYETFTNVWSPSSTAVYAKALRTAQTSNPAPATGFGGGPIDISTNIQGTVSTAVAGVYKRTKTFVWTTAQENYDHYGWVFAGSTGFVYGGFIYVLTNPAKITKSSVNKLTLNLDVTWGRAV